MCLLVNCTFPRISYFIKKPIGNFSPILYIRAWVTVRLYATGPAEGEFTCVRNSVIQRK